MDCIWIGFFVHEILQARILEGGSIPFSRGSSWPRDQTLVSHIAGRFFTTEPPGKLKADVVVSYKFHQLMIVSKYLYILTIKNIYIEV